jgi:hypothetical protein
MSIEIRHIPTNNVAQVWPLVEKYIDASQKKGNGGDYTLDHVKVYLTSGMWILVVAIDAQGVVHGAMTVSFINYPNDRVAFITSTGGKAIVSKESLVQLKFIVQQMGATKLQAAVRPSMKRLLSRTGFYDRYQIVETKL